MKSQTQVSVLKWVISFFCVLLLTLEALPTYGQIAELMEKSSVVLVGTIVKMASVSFPGVQASDKTAVVKVDQVLEKPATVSISAGQLITIELKDPSVFREGVQATFYADGWILGEGVALREIGHELITRALAAPELQEKLTKERHELKDAQLKARIESADIVLMGRVKSVRPATVAEMAPRVPRVTEHDPQWQEAIIHVASGLKGIGDNQEVVVRFPGSKDVAFYGIPKFKVDQEGVFLLQKDKVSGLPKAALAGTTVETYTAQQPLDVLPKEDAEKIRALIPH